MKKSSASVGEGSEGNEVIIGPELFLAGFQQESCRINAFDVHPVLVVVYANLPPALVPALPTTAAVGLISSVTTEADRLWKLQSHDSPSAILHSMPEAGFFLLAYDHAVQILSLMVGDLSGLDESVERVAGMKAVPAGFIYLSVRFDTQR